MDKSIIYKEVEKYIFSAGVLTMIAGCTLKFLFSISFGVLLFWAGSAFCFIVSAINYPKKSEILGLDKQSITTIGKIIKYGFSSGAFLVIVGAVLTFHHISVGRLLINIGLIPMIVYIIWYMIIIWKK